MLTVAPMATRRQLRARIKSEQATRLAAEAEVASAEACSQAASVELSTVRVALREWADRPPMSLTVGLVRSISTGTVPRQPWMGQILGADPELEAELPAGGSGGGLLERRPLTKLFRPWRTPDPPHATPSWDPGRRSSTSGSRTQGGGVSILAETLV